MRNFYVTRKPFFTYLLILSVCLIVYSPVLGKKAVNPDAYIILHGLMEIRDPAEYIRLVSSFGVIDFQPVRDLTFFIDLLVFRTTGIVSFTTVNVLLWSMAGFFLLKLLERIVTEEKKKGAIFWVVLFLSYPLFSQAVTWGMARKHVLAFALMLVATNWFLDWMEGKRAWICAYLIYVAACLSHPLMIFWPCWAFTHLRLHGLKWNDVKKFAAIYGLTGLVLLLTNYAYYTIGNAVVAQHFYKMIPDYYNVSKHLSRLGFAFHQIAYPFKFGFLYYPNLQTAKTGFIAILALGLVILRFRKDRKVFGWVVFILMTFPITLTLDNFFDQYLIVPACGTLILFFYLFHTGSRKQLFTLGFFTLILGSYTLTQVEVWANPLSWATRNYKNFPDCKTGASQIVKHYELKKEKAPIQVLNYMEKNGCLVLNPNSPGAVFRDSLMMLSLIMFYEDVKFPRAVRLEKLKELGRLHYYPQLIYASLLAQEDRAEEVEDASRFVLNISKGGEVRTDELVSQHLRPYCVKKQLSACLQISKFTPPAPLPY